MTAVRLAGTLTAALAVLSVAACSGSDDSTTTGPTTAPASPTSASPSDTAPPTSVAEHQSDADASTTVAAPVTDPPATVVPLIDGVDGTIEPLTPTAGSGIRPLLEWSPVEGAAYYMVVVYAPDGSPYWTWTGVATSVHVGGEPVLDDERPGPSVVDGMTWGIVALDDQIAPIAFSDRRPIAP